MNVERYYTGFSFPLIGTFSLDVSNDGGGRNLAAVTFSDGRYYHGFDDTTATENPGDHASFAAALQTALNAASVAAGGSGSNWTVTWYNSGTPRYSITSGYGAWSATLNSVARGVLGMGASVSGSATLTSGSECNYVKVPHVNATANDSGDYEPQEVVTEAVTGGGLGYCVGRNIVLPQYDWEQQFETPESCFPSYASADAWTWFEFFRHCRGWEPIVLVNTTTGNTGSGFAYSASYVAARAKLRAEGAAAQFKMASANRFSYWHVPFRARILERFAW